jgi:serine/threonine protein kinase/tetratricopeptide (TPR) repeat protein
MEFHLRSDEKELGHYQLRRLLGEGGFGQVYEAWDSKLQRSIAIKRLKPQLASRPENLLDEARMAASLRHPAFVKIFSIDGDADQQSIIMEYVDGSTLRQLSQGQAQPEDKVLDIVCQVAEAMEEAHASKLIHGDIKPSNLMVEATGTVRIMDFGLSRKIDPDATESVVIDETQGTIAYLAPELLLGTTPNEQSDVYALGVVMYEMLTGERPFAHLSGLSLAAAHIQSSSQMWAFPPDTSSTVAELVRSMTARDLNVRLSSMRAVRDATLTLRGKAPPAVHASPQGAPAARIPWYRRAVNALNSPRSRVVLLSFVALVLFVGVGKFVSSSTWFVRYSPFFSESVAMEAGLRALKRLDREESTDLAIRHFSSILERYPDHAAAAAGVSLAYSAKYAGNSRDAVWLQRADASAQLALTLNDQLSLAHVAQGTVRTWQGKFDEALQLAERALRLDPMSIPGLNLKGYTLGRMRRFDNGAGTLDAAIKMYPMESIFHDTLGALRLQQADYVNAEKAFRRSIEIEPDAVIAYANLSYILVRQNRIDEALQTLQHGLQIRPSGQLYSNLGTALFNRGDYVGAAQAFERAVSASKGSINDYLRWANLADTLRWLPGRASESKNAYEKAVHLITPLIEQAPGDVTLMSRLGLYSSRLGERQRALMWTRRALDAAPTNADVHFRAAMAFELCDERDSALAALKTAQERGYPSTLIASEPDLIALRRDPRFYQPTKEGVK